jgi:phage tail P2-like protein
MSARFDRRLVPPSVADARGRAFAEAARLALADPDFRALLFERLDTVDGSALPFLIREFGLHKFIEPGMPEATQRALLRGSFALHGEIGYVRGVRLGLALIGVRVVRWTQWFQATPPAQPGTHRVRIALDRAVFPDEGVAITARLNRAIGRMVRHTQRASQEIGFEIASQAPPVLIHIGMALTSRLQFRSPVLPPPEAPAPEPPRLRAVVGLNVGMGLATRLTFRTRTA